MCVQNRMMFAQRSADASFTVTAPPPYIVQKQIFSDLRCSPGNAFFGRLPHTFAVSLKERRTDSDDSTSAGRPVAALDAPSSVSRARDRNGRSGLVKAPQPTILFISPSPAPRPNPDSSQEREEGRRRRKEKQVTKCKKGDPLHKLFFSPWRLGTYAHAEKKTRRMFLR